MRQKNMLWAVVLLLLLLNAGTLVFVIRDRRHTGPVPNGNFDETVIRTLDLDAAQQEQFDRLKQRHHEQILETDRRMHELFIGYFALLDQGVNSTPQKDSLEQLLAAAYDQKVKITYAHFQELKAICRPGQQVHFRELLPELMRVISPPDKKRPPPSEGNGK